MALAIAFIRGISRRESKTLGNFWVDLTRGTLWVLLPICLVYALALVSQGAIQNLKPYDTVTLIEPQTVTAPGAMEAGDDHRDDADHCAGAAGVAGSHQDAGHQRRRLLQRQQRAPV